MGVPWVFFSLNLSIGIFFFFFVNRGLAGSSRGGIFKAWSSGESYALRRVDFSTLHGDYSSSTQVMTWSMYWSVYQSFPWVFYRAGTNTWLRHTTTGHRVSVISLSLVSVMVYAGVETHNSGDTKMGPDQDVWPRATLKREPLPLSYL